MATDLWPTDIVVTTSTVRTPLLVLREQAALLGNKTQNIVEAKIKTQPTPAWILPSESVGSDNHAFEHSFNLVAPALQNYTYQLFRLVHPIEGYPAQVYFLDDQETVKSENELIESLKRIFAHDKTKQVITALLTQSRQ